VTPVIITGALEIGGVEEEYDDEKRGTRRLLRSNGGEVLTPTHQGPRQHGSRNAKPNGQLPTGNTRGTPVEAQRDATGVISIPHSRSVLLVTAAYYLLRHPVLQRSMMVDCAYWFRTEAIR